MKEHLKPHVSVTNGAGRTFNVVVVLQGEKYGRNDCLTHDKADPLVAFYDATYQGRETFPPEGQFTGARYCMSTLLGLDEFRRADRHPGVGLCLHGSVDAWVVTHDNVTDALRFAWERLMASMHRAVPTGGQLWVEVTDD